MENTENILNFCFGGIFYDYKNIGITDELNQVRECIKNIFHETIPVSRILISLSIRDVMILKKFGKDVENII